MPLTATRVQPPIPEMMPGEGGRLVEVWRLLTADSDTAVDITTDFIDKVESAVGSGNWSHNITSATGKTFTITFGAAPADGITFDVRVSGRKSA